MQYDITAVCNYLGKHKEIRFPGYLLHQFTSLAATLKDLNILYASILDDGCVPTFDEKEIKEELLKGFGIDRRKGNFGIYVPFELRRRILRECMPITAEKKKGESLFDSIKGLVTSREEVNEIAHDALFILEEELIANEELEYQIVKKLKALPDKKIIVHC